MSSSNTASIATTGEAGRLSGRQRRGGRSGRGYYRGTGRGNAPGRGSTRMGANRATFRGDTEDMNGNFSMFRGTE